MPLTVFCHPADEATPSPPKHHTMPDYLHLEQPFTPRPRPLQVAVGAGGGGGGRARTRGGSARRHRFRDAGRLGCFPYNSASVKAISILVASEPPPRRSGDPSRSQAAAQPTRSPVFHRVPCLSADTLARTDLVSACPLPALLKAVPSLQDRANWGGRGPPPARSPPPPSFPAEPQFSLPPRPLPPPTGLPFSEALSNFRLFQQWMVV